MTNREKFKKVFGFTPNEDATCILPTRVCMTQDFCNDCPFDDFWDKEYLPCFKLKEELDE